MKNEPKFGAAIPKEQWIQRTINYDPHPTVTWAHYGPQPMTRSHKLFWTIYVAVVFAVVLFLPGVAAADNVYPPGTTWQQQDEIRMNQERMIQQQQQMIDLQRRQNSYQTPYVREGAGQGVANAITRALRQYEEQKNGR